MRFCLPDWQEAEMFAGVDFDFQADLDAEEGFERTDDECLDCGGRADSLIVLTEVLLDFPSLDGFLGEDRAALAFAVAGLLGFVGDFELEFPGLAEFLKVES